MEKIKINLNIDDSKKEFKKMKEEILNDHEFLNQLRNFKVNEEMLDKFLIRIYSHKCDIDYCKNCKGASACHKENPLLSSELYFDGKYIEQKYTPCKEVLSEMSVANKFLINDMNENLRKADIKTLDKSAPRIQLLQSFLNYLSTKQSKWLYIHGSFKTGRSYVASALANKCAKDIDGTICFIDTPFRFKELYDKSFNDLEAYSKMLETIKNATVLIIDDFGNEVKNDYVRDGILSLILSARSDKKLLTIITSDYTIDEIEALYATTKAGVIRAKQIKNVLKANSEVFNFGDLSIY